MAYVSGKLYVDDTVTASKVVRKGEFSSAQIIADKVVEWSLANSIMRNAKSFEFLLLEIRQYLSQLG